MSLIVLPGQPIKNVLWTTSGGVVRGQTKRNILSSFALSMLQQKIKEAYVQERKQPLSVVSQRNKRKRIEKSQEKQTQLEERCRSTRKKCRQDARERRNLAIFWQDEIKWQKDENDCIEEEIWEIRSEQQEALERFSTELQLINKGVDFLCDHILEGTSREFKERFQSYDQFLMLYVLTKSIWIYVCGAKRKEPVLGVFKQETQREIERLREQFEENELEESFASIESFERGVTNPSMQGAWNKLRALGSREIQGGGLLNECWKGAIDRLT